MSAQLRAQVLLGLPVKGYSRYHTGNVGDLVQPSRDARSPLVWMPKVPKPGLRILVAQNGTVSSSFVQQTDP